eukprot:1149150-Pelagomonas_calceolata.AAC.2
MIGWLPLAKNCLQSSLQTCFCCTNHCFPRPPGTAGLPSSFVWEGSQSLQGGGGLAGPGRQV